MADEWDRSGSHPGCRRGWHPATRKKRSRFPVASQLFTPPALAKASFRRARCSGSTAGEDAHRYGGCGIAARIGSGGHPGCRRGWHPATRKKRSRFPVASQLFTPPALARASSRRAGCPGSTAGEDARRYLGCGDAALRPLCEVSGLVRTWSERLLR